MNEHDLLMSRGRVYGTPRKVLFEYPDVKQYLAGGGDPIKLLLDHGVDPCASWHRPKWPHWDWTPIQMFSSYAFAEAIIRLVDNGASADEALYCSQYCPQNIPLLIQRGADVNTTVGLRTPIKQFLIMHGRCCTKAVETLLRFRPRVDVDDLKHIRKHKDLWSIWVQGKWALVKCAVKLLGLHQRAVVTANHPLRMLERGDFTCKE